MIKKIVILVLLVLGAYLVEGQAPTVFFGEINKGVKARSSLWADSAVYLGVMDTNFIPLRPGAIVFKSNDRRFYGWDGIIWKELAGGTGGGGSGDFIDSVTLYGITMCQWKRGVSTCYDIDTSVISTKYYVTTYVDNAITNLYTILGIDSSKRLLSGAATIDNGFNGHTTIIKFRLGGKVWTVPSYPSFNVGPSHPTQARFVLGVVDTLGNFGLQYCPYGSTNVPLCEETDPGSQLVVARWLIPAASTAPAGAFSMAVYREGIGGEWDVSGTARWNKLFPTLPFLGSVSLKDSSTVAGTYIDFTYSSPIRLDTFDLASMYLKILSTFNNNTRLSVSLMLGNSLVSISPIIISDGNFGFSRTLVNAWMPLVIHRTDFSGGFYGGTFDKIRITLTGPTNLQGFQLDEFYLKADNGASVAPPPTTPFTFQGMDLGTPRQSPVTLLHTDVRGFVDNATFNGDSSKTLYWNNGQVIFQQSTLFKYLTEGYGIDLDTLLPRTIRIGADTVVMANKLWVQNYVAMFGGSSDNHVDTIYVTPDKKYQVKVYHDGQMDSTLWVGGGGGGGGGNIIDDLQQTTVAGNTTTLPITVNSNIKIWRGLNDEVKSIAIGDSTLRLLSGTDNINIAIGHGAMKNSTDAGENIAMGVDAMAANTTGDYSIAIGTRAFSSNTTGCCGIAIGYEAAQRAIGNSGPFAIGIWALRNNTTGAGNMALGYGAIMGSYLGVTGGFNTGLGIQTLDSLSTGAENTAVGYWTMLNMKTGVQNTALGVTAMRYNISGSQNTAVGRYSLWEDPIATGNTVMGFEAGRYAHGNYNILLGYQAGYTLLSSNKLYIENSSSTIPLIYGDFANDSLKFNGHVSIIDGTQGAGKVFTSDALGNGSWQTPSGGSGGGSNWTVDGANIWRNSMVGIGVTPTQQLHIRKDQATETQLLLQNMSPASGGATGLRFESDIAVTTMGVYGSGSSFGPITPGSLYNNYSGSGKMMWNNFGTGAFEWTVYNGSSLASRMVLRNNGILELKAYGTGAITNTPTFNLAVDATGDVVEVPLSSGGGSNWTVTGSDIWRNSQVGIGVIPTRQLHVRKDQASSTAILIENLSSASGAEVGFALKNDIGTNAFMSLYSSATSFGPMPLGSMYLYYDGPGNVVFNQVGAGDITFTTNSLQERFAIKNNGQIRAYRYGTGGVGSSGATFALGVDASGNFLELPLGGGGGGTPAGSNTQIQYNNSGAFGASANLTFNGTTLTVAPNATIHTIKTGGLQLQSLGPNDGSYANNLHHNGSNWIYAANGIGTIQYHGANGVGFLIAPNNTSGAGATATLKSAFWVYQNGLLNALSYGVGTFDSTASVTKALGVTAYGNIVEFPVSSGGGGDAYLANNQTFTKLNQFDSTVKIQQYTGSDAGLTFKARGASDSARIFLSTNLAGNTNDLRIQTDGGRLILDNFATRFTGGLEFAGDFHANLANNQIYFEGVNRFYVQSIFVDVHYFDGGVSLPTYINAYPSSPVILNGGGVVENGDGNVLVGTTTDVASSKFTVVSTTQGQLPPKMTTTQKLAIVSPAAGLFVYDITLNQMSYFNGTTWINF